MTLLLNILVYICMFVFEYKRIEGEVVHWLLVAARHRLVPSRSQVDTERDAQQYCCRHSVLVISSLARLFERDGASRQQVIQVQKIGRYLCHTFKCNSMNCYYATKDDA